MPKKRLHLATRVETHDLLAQPDMVLHQMSIKIFQRRQRLLEELVGTHVLYEVTGGFRSGVVDKLEDAHVIIKDGSHNVRVSLKRLHFD